MEGVVFHGFIIEAVCYRLRRARMSGNKPSFLSSIFRIDPVVELESGVISLGCLCFILFVVRHIIYCSFLYILSSSLIVCASSEAQALPA